MGAHTKTARPYIQIVTGHDFLARGILSPQKICCRVHDHIRRRACMHDAVHTPSPAVSPRTELAPASKICDCSLAVYGLSLVREDAGTFRAGKSSIVRESWWNF